MKVIYSSPAIPINDIQLNTEYDLTIKGEKAILTLDEFRIELTKYQAETMFVKVEEKQTK